MKQSETLDPMSIVDVDLTTEERFLLRRGLSEWGGPTRCTEELAIAMGFEGIDGLYSEGRRIASLLDSGNALTRLDLLRAVLATEFAFISDTLGSGSDWVATVGMSDSDTIALLRELQRKTTKHVRSLLGDGLGNR